MLNLLQTSLSIEYTRRDFSEGMRIMNSSQKYHLVFRVIAITSFLVASNYLYLSFNAINSIQIPSFLIFLLYLLALVLWFDIPRVLSSRRLFNKFQEHGYEKIVLIINADGVFSKTNLSESHSGLEQFDKIFENEELFILVLKTKNFLIFPKRYFSSDEDMTSFRKLAKGKVPEYKLVK